MGFPRAFALIAACVLICAVTGINTLQIRRIEQTAVEPTTVIVQALDHDTEAQERILHLPEDGDVWHTSVFVRPEFERFPADRRLVAAFEAEPRLASLKAQTKYHVYTADSPIYKDRFKTAVPILPSVLVQTSRGQVIYKASGDRVALHPGVLATDISATIRRRCPNGHCRPDQGPLPEPDEGNQPQPQPAPAGPIPDLTAPDPPPAGKESILALGGLFAAVFLTAIGLKIKNEAGAS